VLAAALYSTVQCRAARKVNPNDNIRRTWRLAIVLLLVVPAAVKIVQSTNAGLSSALVVWLMFAVPASSS
jgi:hypothetical protein